MRPGSTVPQLQSLCTAVVVYPMLSGATSAPAPAGALEPHEKQLSNTCGHTHRVVLSCRLALSYLTCKHSHERQRGFPDLYLYSGPDLCFSL